MELILWRHADAEEALGDMSDADRALTAKGKKQARKIAKWLEKRVQDNVRVMVSPALRARETADAYTNHAQIDPRLAVGTAPKAVLAAIGWPDSGDTVIVVGHQPTLGRLAALLLTGKESDWDIKKGSLWWLTSRTAADGAIEVTLRAVMAPSQA